VLVRPSLWSDEEAVRAAALRCTALLAMAAPQRSAGAQMASRFASAMHAIAAAPFVATPAGGAEAGAGLGLGSAEEEADALAAAARQHLSVRVAAVSACACRVASRRAAAAAAAEAEARFYLGAFEGGAAFAYALNSLTAARLGELAAAHSWFAKAHAGFVHGPFHVWTEYAGGTGCPNLCVSVDERHALEDKPSRSLTSLAPAYPRTAPACLHPLQRHWRRGAAGRRSRRLLRRAAR
jgi:hypothetical protein